MSEPPPRGKAVVRDHQAMMLQKELEDRKAAQRQRLVAEGRPASSSHLPPAFVHMGANPYIDAMPAAPPPEKLVSDENRAMLEAARAVDLLAGLRAEVELVVGGETFWGLQAFFAVRAATTRRRRGGCPQDAGTIAPSL